MNELQKYKEQQLAKKIHNMNVSNLSKDEILKSFDKDELNIIKSQFGKMLDVIEKSKSAVTGEIREWSGKKYKKQPNGKWLEVSESHGKNWKEHEREADKIIDEGRKTTHKPKEVESFEREADTHYEHAEKLSDKEHSDEEVGLSEKTREKLEKEIEKLKYNDQYGKSSIEEHVRLMNAKKELSELK